VVYDGKKPSEALKETAMRRALPAFGFGSIIGLVFFWTAACSSRPGVKTAAESPAVKDFYEKARLIMTSEEGKIWKALPDEPSKEEFIAEFWKIRDPDPGTEENEAIEEFEERVRYANTWFGTFNPRRGYDAEGVEEEKSRTGWNEDRGRVYIILGPPDVIYFMNNEDETVSHDGSRYRPKAEDWTMEQWIYDRYRAYVVFSKSGNGNWRMESRDPHFFEVMEWAKLNWVSADFKEDIKRRFRFRPEFSPAGFRFSVPVSRISFSEDYKAEFGIKINVYLNRKKIDTIEQTKTIQETEEELLDKKNLEFEISYEAGEKGEYLFDIIIQDKLAPGLSKYRSFLRRKV
jgi:GWxTD domain-containing protein